MKRIFVSVAVCATLALAAAACSSSADGGMPSQGGGGEGQGGSMARFTIVGDCLYTVDHTTLKVVDISNPAHPGAMPFKDVELGFDIETIFYYDDMLFIGSRSAMHIYDISRPHYPSELSVTRHFRWVLSIPFFISCIRQQNPLTVLSKIILRKVKQFNLPPKKNEGFLHF